VEIHRVRHVHVVGERELDDITDTADFRREFRGDIS